MKRPEKTMALFDKDDDLIDKNPMNWLDAIDLLVEAIATQKKKDSQDVTRERS